MHYMYTINVQWDIGNYQETVFHRETQSFVHILPSIVKNSSAGGLMVIILFSSHEYQSLKC